MSAKVVFTDVQPVHMLTSSYSVQFNSSICIVLFTINSLKSSFTENLRFYNILVVACQW